MVLNEGIECSCIKSYLIMQSYNTNLTYYFIKDNFIKGALIPK